MKIKKIRTKNKKEYIATSNDGLYWTIRSKDGKQVKSTGIIADRQITNAMTTVNSNMSIREIAEYLSKRGF